MKIARYGRLLVLLAQLTYVISTPPTDDESPAITTTIPFASNTIRSLPKIEDGHRQFQFFNLDPDGKLLKQWMSLQEVQNIILAYALTRQSESDHLQLYPSPYNARLASMKAKGAADHLLAIAGKDPKKKLQASVDDVLANVQKVMSKEMTNSFLKEDMRSPSISATEISLSEDESSVAPKLTVPDVILANLMKEQVVSLETHNPWGIMTKAPSTEIFEGLFLNVEEDNYSTTSLPTLNENVLEDTTSLIEESAKAITQAVTVETDSPTTLAETENLFRNDITLSSDDQVTENYLDTATTEGTTYVESFTETEMNSDDIFTIRNNFVETTTLLPIEVDTVIDNYITSSSGNEMDLETTTSNMNYENEETTQRRSEDEMSTLLTKISYTHIPAKHLSKYNTIIDLSEEDVREHQITTTQNSFDNESALIIELENQDEISDNILDTENKIIPSSLDNYDMQYLNSKSSGDINIKSFVKPIPASTNVLTPLELAQISKESVASLGSLQESEDYSEYEFDDLPVYLEDLAELDYSKDEDYANQKTLQNQSSVLDFPSPEATNSYHKPDHVTKQEALVDVDPTQFLPSHNPSIAGENPLDPTPLGNEGLEVTTADLDPEIKKYVDAMNNIAFQVYKGAIKIHRRQNLVMSPLNLISSLSMLLLGARSQTADSLSELLRTDEFLMFNPHLVLKNVTNSVLDLNNIGHETALVNNIFIEKPKQKPYDLSFFSRTLDIFYSSLVKQVPKSEMGDAARDEANGKVRQQTFGLVQNFLKPNATLRVWGPLSLVSSAYFQGDWSEDISEENLVDMNFIRFPSAERRLIRTVGINRRLKINAGYSEELDATVAEIPLKSSSREISLMLVMPGQQKSFVANGLSELEHSLTPERWSKLLKSVIPHTLNFKMPIFSHRNYLNLSGILPDIGLGQLFENSADFSGINGAKNLYLGDVAQLTEFHSCKLDMKMFAARSMKMDDIISKLSEETQNENYEVNGTRNPEMEGPKSLKKSFRKEEASRRERKEAAKASYRADKTLAYDRAFFYLLRHNPTGLILFMGRYLDPETF